MTRILPGVYVTLNDYSTLPESEDNLTVGYVLQAKRGPVGKCELVTSPTDFLTKYTFSGAPAVTDDPTYWSILKVLGQTNQVYVSRASKNAKFGGLVIKKETELGTVSATAKPTGTTDGGTITVNSVITATAGDIVRIFGKSTINGRYKVKTATTSETTTTITVETADTTSGLWTAIPADYTAASGDNVKLIKTTTPTPLQTGITDPEGYTFAADDLFLITGVDEGAYNNEIYINIVSDTESPEQLTESGMMQIQVLRSNGDNTFTTLETWMCNRTEGGKTFDGSVAYINTVLEASAYIRGYNNTAVALAGLLPGDCSHANLGGGTDGDELTTSDDLTSALELFADKTIPVSILGNGTGSLYENVGYQQKMISIAKTREDCVAFLNSRYSEDERATSNSAKADNIVNYKKGTLGSTDWCATMYAPHVNSSDGYNSRTIRLGSDSVAIAGWLQVIHNQGYPYAYAGPTYGLVEGVTTNWKIGDNSGEAKVLNNASVNYVAYDAKVGRYYMQAQNTLQIANSSLRNLGAVFNVLDMKETFQTYLKEYLQRPITDALRSEILLQIKNQMETILSNGRVLAYTVTDGTTATDLADNTLRYTIALQLTPYAQKIYLSMNIVADNIEFSIYQG